MTSDLELFFYLSYIACYYGQDYVNLVAGGRRQISRLKVGDQVWTISNDGKRLIQDEIICILYIGLNTPSLYQFV